MNRDMFGTLPDGSLYTKRRNLWTRPSQNVVTYQGYECEKVTCGLKQTKRYLTQELLPFVGSVGRETHFTVSFDYIYIERQRGTTNPMSEVYCDGHATDSASSWWFGAVDIKGNRNLIPGSGWKHHTFTFAFNVDKVKAYRLNIYPVYLRDVDADLYIRNIMVTYGDEDYPYTPAPEIDPTKILSNYKYRNLISGSGISLSSTTSGNVSSKRMPWNVGPYDIKGKILSLSFDLELINAVAIQEASYQEMKRVGFETSFRKPDGSIYYLGKWIALTSTPQNLKERIKMTSTFPSVDFTAIYTEPTFYIQGLASGTAKVSNLMIELGNTPHDWEPAPEDGVI